MTAEDQKVGMNMKTLYLECAMGAAGDMLMAALLELIPDKQAFIERMNGLGLPGVHVAAEPSVKCGITGTHMQVTVDGEEEESEDVHEHHHHEHDHEHHDHEHHHDHVHEHHHHEHDHEHHHQHASVSDIQAVIDGLAVSDQVKKDAKAVYALIAEAESKVHGRPVSEIHFHEVHVGSGHVRCMHGILPVPAPATALILTGVPTYGGQVLGELCTPTGAALLKHFVSRFGDRPVMTSRAIGYGMGKKDFERANCVRAFLGESEGEREALTKLECNLDDMTGEDIGFAMEQLFKAGALDVYTQAIGMKKSRPGVLLSVICPPDHADNLAAVMMKHTSTLGIRRQDMSRYVLARRMETIETPYGPVRVKIASGMGVEKMKAEYDDLKDMAEKHNVTLNAVRKEADTVHHK